ncbi:MULTISPECIES: IclR family transcriptional regulator [unclassified Mycolicibacterium]|uniref:IclR family transcriptional regulator n=1 Tax=unclassified Mycolicibacterium TaxID=2636767 RepID=UPI002ED9DB46
MDNTLRILLLLRDRGRLTIADVAASLDIARSSAHRLMAMLVYYDYVRQDPADRAYRIGPALIDIGLSAARVLDVRRLARPVLTDLVDSTGLTAHLVLPRGRNVLFADGVESQRTIRAALRTGTTLPAHATSGGKALLAALSDDELHKMYAHTPPEALTKRSVSSMRSLLHEIAKVRRMGYAINQGESEDGVLAMGVACAIPDADLAVAITVSGPDAPISEKWEKQTAESLFDAANELRKQIQTYRL